MPSQAEREAKFIWRPNDNSDTTNLRYDLEMDKWMTAYKNNERKHKHSSIKEDFHVIGLLLSLVFTLLTLVVLGLIQLVNWLRK